MVCIVAQIEVDQKSWEEHFAPFHLFVPPITRVLEAREVSGQFVLFACEEQLETDLIGDSFHVDGSFNKSVILSCLASGFPRLRMRLDIKSLEAPGTPSTADPGDQLHDLIAGVREIAIDNDALQKAVALRSPPQTTIKPSTNVAPDPQPQIEPRRLRIEPVIAEDLVELETKPWIHIEPISKLDEPKEEPMAKAKQIPLDTDELCAEVMKKFGGQSIGCQDLNAFVRELERWSANESITYRIQLLRKNNVISPKSGSGVSTVYSVKGTAPKKAVPPTPPPQSDAPEENSTEHNVPENNEQVATEMSPPEGFEKYKEWVALREQRRAIKLMIAIHTARLVTVEERLAGEPSNVKEALDLHEYLHHRMHRKPAKE